MLTVVILLGSKKMLYVNHFSKMSTYKWLNRAGGSILFAHSIFWENKVPYARHFKPRLVYYLPHFSVQSRAVNITDNLRTKQGNVDLNSAVYLKSGFKWRAGYNGVHRVSEGILAHSIMENSNDFCFFNWNPDWRSFKLNFSASEF